MSQLISNPEDKYLHIGKRVFICDYCGSVVKGPVFHRYHDKKCKNYREIAKNTENKKSDCIV